MKFIQRLLQTGNDGPTDDLLLSNPTMVPSMMPSIAPSADDDSFFGSSIAQYTLVCAILLIVIIAAGAVTLRAAKISSQQSEFMRPAPSDVKESQPDNEYYQISETDYLIEDQS